MAFDNTVTVVGNLTRDPELRFTNSGLAVATFGLAWNQKKDGEETAHFFDITTFQDLAENVATTLFKGMRAIVYGRLDFQTWESDDGSKRTAVKVLADEVSPSLRWASADVTRNERTDSGGAKAKPAPKNEEPW